MQFVCVRRSASIHGYKWRSEWHGVVINSQLPQNIRVRPWKAGVRKYAEALKDKHIYKHKQKQNVESIAGKLTTRWTAENGKILALKDGGSERETMTKGKIIIFTESKINYVSQILDFNRDRIHIFALEVLFFFVFFFVRDTLLCVEWGLLCVCVELSSIRVKKRDRVSHVIAATTSRWSKHIIQDTVDRAQSEETKGETEYRHGSIHYIRIQDMGKVLNERKHNKTNKKLYLFNNKIHTQNNKIYYLDCNKFPKRKKAQNQRKKMEQHLVGGVNRMSGWQKKKQYAEHFIFTHKSNIFVEFPQALSENGAHEPYQGGKNIHAHTLLVSWN